MIRWQRARARRRALNPILGLLALVLAAHLLLPAIGALAQ